LKDENAETIKKANAHLDKEYKAAKEELAGKAQAVEEQRAAVTRWTERKSEGPKLNAITEGHTGGTKWYSYKGREFNIGDTLGKKALSIAGAFVSVGAIVVGLKNISRGVGLTSQKDEEGKEVPSGFGTLVMGVGELGLGGLGLMNSITRGKGAAIA
jgi:hypothetical protein